MARRKPVEGEAASETTPSGPGMPHALFPHDGTDEDPHRDVGWILVTRQGPTGWETAPRMHVAEELCSIEALYEAYGGGSYELIARDSERHRITDRRQWRIAGPSKPLAPVPMAEPVPMPMVHAPAGSGDPMVAMFMAMMSNMTQLQIASQQSTAQLISAIMARKDETANPLVELVRAQSEMNSQILTANLSRPAGHAPSEDRFREGVDFGLDMAKIAGKEEAPDTTMADVSSMVQGLASLSMGAPKP